MILLVDQDQLNRRALKSTRRGKTAKAAASDDNYVSFLFQDNCTVLCMSVGLPDPPSQI